MLHAAADAVQCKARSGKRQPPTKNAVNAPTRMRSKHTVIGSVLVSLVAATAAVVVGGASARHLDTLWDEHVDQEISIGLQQHPFTGEQPTLDGSQMRLPMVLNALAYTLTGRNDISISRAVSLLTAALTVVAAAALARLLFDPLVGSLTAILLALSPYFLSYARVAMTEGDIFFACLTTLAIWAFVRYQRETNTTNWIIAAVFLGLAVGAKVFAVFLFIVFALLALSRGHAPPPSAPARGRDVRTLHRLLTAGIVLIVITGTAALIAREAHVAGSQRLAALAHSAAICGWGLLFGCWAIAIAFARRQRVLAPSRAARILGLGALATMTFFALMPVHLIEHDIARDVVRRVLHWNATPHPADLGDHLRLYSGILLIKLTVPLGLLSAAALPFAAVQALHDPRWRPCLLAVAIYVAGLCLLPLRQSFYLMGIYPLIVILTAAFVVHIGRWLRDFSRNAQTVWALVVCGLCIHLLANLVTTYPHLHLYGHELLADRWLGEEARGDRNLIQTPSDGVESLIRWCNTDPRVRPGDRVVSFLWDQAIIEDTLAQDRRYVFVPRGVTPQSDALPPPPAIENADFVLLHINNFLGYAGRPPDHPPSAVLGSQSLDPDFTLIHTVHRAGIEIAWVYARR